MGLPDNGGVGHIHYTPANPSMKIGRAFGGLCSRCCSQLTPLSLTEFAWQTARQRQFGHVEAVWRLGVTLMIPLFTCNQSDLASRLARRSVPTEALATLSA